MGAQFDELVSSKIRLGKGLTVTLAEVLLVLLIGTFALLARIGMLGHVSGDYTQFLSGWYDALKNAGGLPGIGLSLGDYTPPYIYTLALLTYLPVSSLFSIKLVSILFDLLLAFGVMRAVYSLHASKSAAIGAYAAVLFAPTVLLNGAYWAQCDGIFTALLVFSLCYFLKDRPLAGTICFAAAFCLKLQAIFFAPLLLLLWLKGRIKLRHFLAIPAAYLVSILPAWIAGRPFSELLTIYLHQSGQYSRICMNAPNLYIFIKEDRSAALGTAAILVCAVLLLLCLYFLWSARFPLTKEVMITAALFFSILLPFFLPRMHERYFYVADVFSILYAFARPKKAYVSLLVIGASAASYLPFLFGHEPFDLRAAALMMLAALFAVGLDLFRTVRLGLKGAGDGPRRLQ